MKYRHKKMGLIIEDVRVKEIDKYLHGICPVETRPWIYGTICDTGESHFEIGVPFGDWAENWVECQ